MKPKKFNSVGMVVTKVGLSATQTNPTKSQKLNPSLVDTRSMALLFSNPATSRESFSIFGPWFRTAPSKNPNTSKRHPNRRRPSASKKQRVAGNPQSSWVALAKTHKTYRDKQQKQQTRKQQQQETPNKPMQTTTPKSQLDAMTGIKKKKQKLQNQRAFFKPTRRLPGSGKSGSWVYHLSCLGSNWRNVKIPKGKCN